MLKIITLLIWSSVPSYASELPDTGQTLCYDGSGTLIACPAPKAALAQDASYNPVAARLSYNNNGDGTISDNTTGLIWMANGNHPFNGSTSTGTWEQALGYCENLVYAGQSDWRLPNRRELLSIVDFGADNPALKTGYFTNTQTVYWTSTTYKPTTTSAWVVFLNYGNTGFYSKTDSYSVRCVRAGP